jgi:hypothetical protein
VADVAWTILTILLVIVSLVVLAVGFPGTIGKGVRGRLLRRSRAARRGDGAARSGIRDA